MAVITREVFRCDVCGHEWIPVVAEPERCPSRKCRALGWNGGTSAWRGVDKGGAKLACTSETDQRQHVPIMTMQEIADAESPAKPVAKLLSDALCRHRLYGPLCRQCRSE
jgi:hypothetical protein